MRKVLNFQPKIISCRGTQLLVSDVEFQTNKQTNKQTKKRKEIQHT